MPVSRRNWHNLYNIKDMNGESINIIFKRIVVSAFMQDGAFPFCGKSTKSLNWNCNSIY